MTEWGFASIPDFIVKSLVKHGFKSPTAIQQQVISHTINQSVDILGAAPTGSGKTLAFGIPLITKVYKLKLEEIHDQHSENVTSSYSMSSKLDPRKWTENACRKTENVAGIYSNLDIIEELDPDSHEVRKIHSIGSRLFSEESVTDSGGIMNDLAPPHNVNSQVVKRVYGLVLLPTRELAIQVSNHLRLLTEFADPPILIETIVGGISVQKQTRLLQRSPEIIVATPGRLWQFIERGDLHVLTIKNANMLVVDEADRLVEANHFEELRALFDWLHSAQLKRSEGKVRSTNQSKFISSFSRQIFVFSATLTFVHNNAIKAGTGAKNRRLHSSTKKIMTTKLKLGMLKKLIGLKNPKIIDLSMTGSATSPDPSTPSGSSLYNHNQFDTSSIIAPNGLSELRLICPNQADKDVQLFWFLTFGRFSRQSGIQGTPVISQRCLIFMNSKAGVRRLSGVMRQLAMANAFQISGQPSSKHINVLHAEMIQKQRLRALERFQTDPFGILIASDVAARGLDLASLESHDHGGIKWVIHFEVPHTAELYIHRRGRTARANRTGTSLLLICPNEVLQWRRLASNLKRNVVELPHLAVTPTNQELNYCREIVNLAQQLDLISHTQSRDAANRSWFKMAAKEADIQLSDDESGNESDQQIRKKSRLDFNHLQTRLIRLVHVVSDQITKRPRKDFKQHKHIGSQFKLMKKLRSVPC